MNKKAQLNPLIMNNGPEETFKRTIYNVLWA